MDASTLQTPTAWITGAKGLIGNYVLQTFSKAPTSWRIRALTRTDLDLTDTASVRREFQKDSPKLIIHCAALAHTPSCEKNPALARKLNVEITAVLAELAANIPFIFFSTDLVFDGLKGHYDESAETNPLSVYAKTKIEAEKIVLANPKHTVLRTSLNFGDSLSGDRAFNEQMRKTVERGEPLKLFTDEFRCPIPAEETAHAVRELARQNRPGLYHLAGSERLSRWEIGRLLANHWEPLQTKIEPLSIRDFRDLPRSPDTSLNCEKIQRLLPFPLPRFSDWLTNSRTRR